MPNDTLQSAHLLIEGAHLAAHSDCKVRTLNNSQENNELREKQVWITVFEGAHLLSLRKRAVQKNLRLGKYISRRVLGNGGEQYQILLTSLPRTAQEKYWETRLPARAPGTEKTVVEAVKINPEMLTDKQREIALLRYNVLRHFRKAADAGWGKRRARQDDFLRRYNGGEWSRLLAATGTLCLRTLQQWMKALNEADNDCFALAPKWQKPERAALVRIGTAARNVSAIEMEMLLRFALSPNQPLIAEVIRNFRREVAELGLAFDASDMTYRRALEDFQHTHSDQWTFMREGKKALTDKVLPSMIRDWEKVNVGDMVFADGHVMNFEVINPYTGKAKRMMLVAVFEPVSNFVLGWEIMPSENTAAIASAYRRAVLRLGFVPRIFYIDNGRAFKSKYFTESITANDEGGFAGLFERMKPYGFKEVMLSKPYHGQTKSIERFWGTQNELARRMPTYSGTSTDNKPAWRRRGEFEHRELREKLLSGVSISLQDAHYIVAEWADEYHSRPQQQGHIKGRTPSEVFAEGLSRVVIAADFERRQISPAELNLLMMPVEVKRLERNGIRFLGHYYYAPELYAFEKSKTKFSIRYDLESPDALLVYQSGLFVCEAHRTDKVHPAARLLGTAQDQSQLSAALAVQKQLTASTLTSSRDFALQNNLPAARLKMAAGAEQVALESQNITPEPKPPARKKFSIFQE